MCITTENAFCAPRVLVQQYKGSIYNIGIYIYYNILYSPCIYYNKYKYMGGDGFYFFFVTFPPGTHYARADVFIIYTQTRARPGMPKCTPHRRDTCTMLHRHRGSRRTTVLRPPRQQNLR